MNDFNWERVFSILVLMIYLPVFNTTIRNIMANFILHDISVCNDKDPSWINNRVKKFTNKPVSVRTIADIRTQIFEK